MKEKRDRRAQGGMRPGKLDKSTATGAPGGKILVLSFTCSLEFQMTVIQVEDRRNTPSHLEPIQWNSLFQGLFIISLYYILHISYILYFTYYI